MWTDCEPVSQCPLRRAAPHHNDKEIYIATRDDTEYNNVRMIKRKKKKKETKSPHKI